MLRGHVTWEAHAVAADFQRHPGAGERLRRAETATPTGSKARRIGPATIGTGARRSASKSSIALALTEAADASFATDQPSRVRAERHWAAESIALG